MPRCVELIYRINILIKKFTNKQLTFSDIKSLFYPLAYMKRILKSLMSFGSSLIIIIVFTIQTTYCLILFCYSVIYCHYSWVLIHHL